MRRASLTTEEFTEYTFDGAAAHDGEGMAAVGGDDPVVLEDTVLKADRHNFLLTAEVRAE